MRANIKDNYMAEIHFILTTEFWFLKKSDLVTYVYKGVETGLEGMESDAATLENIPKHGGPVWPNHLTPGAKWHCTKLTHRCSQQHSL